MPLRLLDLRGNTAPLEQVLPRPHDPGSDVHDAVAEVLGQVRQRGDEAIIEYAAAFDQLAVADAADLRVPPDEVMAARSRVPYEVNDALELSYERIESYHAHEGTPPGPFQSGGVTVDHLARPVRRAGLYAPGGRARYPSTVLMCAAPARVAGVEDIVLCVPPAADGRVDDATLAAAAVAGITEVYRIGGPRPSPPWPSAPPPCPGST